MNSDRRIESLPSFNRGYVCLVFTATLVLCWLFFADRLLAPHQVLNASSPTLEGVLTHQLFHADGLHLFVNLLGIIFCGWRIETFWGSRRFFMFTLFCAAGIAGLGLGVGFAASQFGWLTPGALCYGASGLVFSYLIFLAVAHHDDLAIGSITIRQLSWAAIIAGLAGLAALDAQGGTTLVLQLAGVPVGLATIWAESRIRRFFEFQRQVAEDRREERVVDIRLQVDELLDKIHESGIESLTNRERSFLRSASKHYKQS
ncbi:MAG: rhomboid family intramembrane serine protease [Planctomycetota bacterium]